MSHRWFTVFAVLLMTGFGSIEAFASDDPTDNSDSYALIIVNKDYRHAPNIPHAYKDGAAIKRFLETQGFDKTRIQVLANEPAAQWATWLGTENNPRGRLWREMSAVNGRGNVFVYVVGHGLPVAMRGQSTVSSHLLPTEVDPTFAADLAPSVDMIERNLEEVKRILGERRWVILMLEACFSGKTAAGVDLTPPGMMAIARPTLEARPSTILRISAAATDETAWWDDKNEGGLLTRAFISALEGGETVISGREIRQSVRRKVIEAARTLRGVDQTPWIDAGLDQVTFSALTKSTESAPTKNTDRSLANLPTSAEPVERTPIELSLFAKLFEEGTVGSNTGIATAGKVRWNVSHDKLDGSTSPDKILEAQVNIPARGISAIITIRPNRDNTTSGSHILEISFALNSRIFDGRGIQTVPGIILKEAENSRGDPLFGKPERIERNRLLLAFESNYYEGIIRTERIERHFSIALAAPPSNPNHNISLLRERGWIDIPIVYETGKRAILTIAKGVDGDGAVKEAIADWEKGGG